MYKNFNLTDEERQQILEQHKSHGYKKPLSEQSTWNKYNRITSPTGQDFYEPNPDYDPNYKEPKEVVKFKPLYERVYFNNGGNISIQASRTAYSKPRNDEGPYTHMEMGYPSKNTVLPKNVLKYVEQSATYNDDGSYSGNDPYNSVYPYVPVSVIKQLIQANGGIKSGELPPMSDKPMEYDPHVKHGKKKEMDEDFDGMASKIEPYSKFESKDRLLNSITDRLITAAQLQEWSLVEEVVSDLISFKKNQPSDEPMKDDYESSVENDDYDERQERNYGVED